MLFNPKPDSSVSDPLVNPGRGGVRLEREPAARKVSKLIQELPLSTAQCDKALSNPRPSLLQKLKLLQHVPSDTRVRVFSELLQYSSFEPKDQQFIRSVLTNAGHHLKEKERRQLLKTLIDDETLPDRAGRWLALARSATSLEEAHRHIARCNRASVLALGDRELKEFVATVELIGAFRAIDLPSAPRKHVTQVERLEEYADEVKEAYAHARSILQESLWAQGTKRFKQLARMLETSEKDFRRSLKSVDEIAPLLRSALHVGIEKLSLELNYGIACTADTSGGRGRADWGLNELRCIRKCLEEVGSYPVTRLDTLHSFHRTKVIQNEDQSTDIADYGPRAKAIWVSDDCFNRGESAGRLGRSPEEIVLHELGHALSLGDLDKLDRKVRARSTLYGLGDLLRNDIFAEEFLRIGRWVSLTKNFAVDQDSRVVTLKGRKIQLEEPVELDGEVRVHYYLEEYKMLCWYLGQKGEFPLKAYGRGDPCEIFADAFQAYHRRKNELIRHAPNVFAHLESLYHRYADDTKVQRRLRLALIASAIRSPVHTAPKPQPNEQNAFSVLSRRDQQEVLRRLGDDSAAWSSKDPDRRELIGRFQKLSRNGYIREESQPVLLAALSEYNPGLLLARAALQRGEDVAVASIRGSTAQEPNAQDALVWALVEALGPHFNRKEIYFLRHHKHSARLGRKSYHEKMGRIIEEHLNGSIVYPSGQVKHLEQVRDRVVVYTAERATLAALRKYAKHHKLTGKIELVDVSGYDSLTAAKELLGATTAPHEVCSKTLHLFTLESTLLDLPASFSVRLKNGGANIRSVELRQFLHRDDPRVWLNDVAKKERIDARELYFCSAEFDNPTFLARVLAQGWDEYRMCKALRSSGRAEGEGSASIP
jgi:hypothetical protein